MRFTRPGARYTRGVLPKWRWNRSVKISTRSSTARFVVFVQSLKLAHSRSPEPHFRSTRNGLWRSAIIALAGAPERDWYHIPAEGWPSKFLFIIFGNSFREVRMH